MAVVTETPVRLGLHTHPSRVAQAREEAIRALQLRPDIHTIIVEDDDAYDDTDAGASRWCMPVTFAEVRIGQMGFAGRQALGDQEEQIISIISRELGGPIRMATLVEEAQRLATIDPLTGLMNRRAFLNALDIEIERSMRLDTPLSLMLMDVDHFKAINDNRGHASGDAVLAAIGRLIVKQARRVDLVARWGGEEFVVALVGADAVTGATAAERYREAVQKMTVARPHRRSDPDHRFVRPGGAGVGREHRERDRSRRPRDVRRQDRGPQLRPRLAGHASALTASSAAAAAAG